MRNFLLATLSAAAVTFASHTACAADGDMAPAAYDWSGPYIGVQAGYSFGDSIHTDDGGDTSGNFDIDGFLGGVTAGWNHQVDGLVFGIEGDISAADISGEEPLNCDDSCKSDIDWLGTARLRAGFAMDSLLLFASGGLAVGGVSAELDEGVDGSGDDTNFGWTIGAGAEWAATDNLSFKVEYLFVDLGGLEYGDEITADFDENHIVRAGVNWLF